MFAVGSIRDGQWRKFRLNLCLSNQFCGLWAAAAPKIFGFLDGVLDFMQ
jgi:hypothetical protein